MWHTYPAVTILIALFASTTLPCSAAETPAELAALREAYMQPIPWLAARDKERFLRGRTLFRQNRVAAPATGGIAGLGPLYNKPSCLACHPNNGRGSSPRLASERMQTMLVRFSLPGSDEHGGPKPHPVYGTQLNEEGVLRVPGEGRATLSWIELPPDTLAGGEKAWLRRPLVSFDQLAYGKPGTLLYSLRVAQPVYGLGLLEAVPEEAILAMAAEAKPDGVKGSVNKVWDIAAQRATLGRFGFKAGMPGLRQQVAGEMHGNLGITSPLFPEENCTPAQDACRQAPSGGQPELGQADLEALEFYLANIDAPPRRKRDDPQVHQGEQAFADFGCAVCHRQSLPTGPGTRLLLTAEKPIAPYTDLLLHDMGEGLADHRPEYQASGSQWRTPPLWGIGLVPLVNEHNQYLHDGRARNLQEAILWHGGEGRVARQRYASAPQEKRQALLVFLQSL
ncbi:MAG: di-heme oxidoredictase family protein [Azonexus sp.]